MVICDELIAKLPHGIRRWIGKNGFNLSLAVNNSEFLRPYAFEGYSIILLDETTASPDAENEAGTENPNWVLA